MFAPSSRRADFSDTLVLAMPGPLPPAGDPLEQLLAAERSDWVMLRLVLCSALATLVLGVAGSLIA